MGVLRWIKEAIFGKPEPEPEPPVFFIFGPKPKPEAWREAEEEAREEWRAEPRMSKSDEIDKSCDILAETKSLEEAKAENPYEVSDEDIWRRYDEMGPMWSR